MNTYPFRNERVRCPGWDIAGWGPQRIDPVVVSEGARQHLLLVARLVSWQWKHTATNTIHLFITSTNDTKINPLQNHFQVLGVLKTHRKSENSKFPGRVGVFGIIFLRKSDAVKRFLPAAGEKCDEILVLAGRLRILSAIDSAGLIKTIKQEQRRSITFLSPSPHKQGRGSLAAPQWQGG